MFKGSLRYVILAIVIGWPAVSVRVAWASAEPFLMRATKEGVNVRADASVQSPEIISLQKDELVEAVEERYEWYKIILPERVQGYIHEKFILPVKESEGKVNGSSVNIRQQPDSSSQVIGTIKKGENVDLLGKEQEWYKVKAYPNGRGWVYSKLCKKVADENALGKSSLLSQVPHLKSKDGVVVVSNLYPQGFSYLKADTEKTQDVSTLRLFQKDCIVEGTLKKNEHTSWCPVPYKVTTDYGVIFVNSKSSVDPLQGKKVKVWGTYVLGKECIYIEADSLKVQ